VKFKKTLFLEVMDEVMEREVKDLEVSEMDNVSNVDVRNLLDVMGLVLSLVEIELSHKAGILSGECSRLCRRLVIDDYMKVMGDVEGGLLERNREEFEDWLRETVLKEVWKGSGRSVRSSTFSCWICTVEGERVIKFLHMD
jgi:hypothetical protein